MSGRRRGLAAAAARGGLRLAAVGYGWAVRVRNWRYDTGRAAAARLEVPVVSVGNLTLGGTGKTPLVAWLARWLRGQSVRVAIVSRGYAAGDDGLNDEAAVLYDELPDVPQVQNADRVAAARLAVDELAAQWILLDDGFQHRRLHRDLDIVLLDALEPWGFGYLFPRGMLREPIGGLRRAQVVVLSRADLIEPAQREAIRRQVQSHAPQAVWCEASHQPHQLRSAAGRTAPLEELRGCRVAAFCGLGNPAAFRRTLAACGSETVAFREFPDHHRYTRHDVQQLHDWAAQHAARAVVCTHKDLVKLGVERLAGKPLWALTIRVTFLAGQPALEDRLRALLARLPAE